VREGKVYAATADTGLCYALDAKTGAMRFFVGFKHWPMFSSPALVGKFAYIGSHLGRLVALDLTSGSVA
jgi:outer membrane protein assembly factor BamB